MNVRRYAIAIGMAVCVALAAGCSSGGVGGPVPSGSDSSSGQAAVAIYVQEWAQVLWNIVVSQTGTQTPSVGPILPNPDDGTIGQTIVQADGTVVVLTFYPTDGTMTIEFTHPNGVMVTHRQSRPVFDGQSKTTIDWEVTSTEGLSVDYTSVVDDMGTITDISDDITELSGTALLPDNVSQQFGISTGGGATSVTSTQSDGTTFTMATPLADPDYILPEFGQSTTGTYTGLGHDIQFRIEATSGAPTRWARLASDFGGGLTGNFALEPDLGGSGRLLDDGSVIALMSWTRWGEGTVNYLTAGRSATSPAGAAIDFLTHQWQTLSALLAPAPGISSAQWAWIAGPARAHSMPGDGWPAGG